MKKLFYLFIFVFLFSCDRNNIESISNVKSEEHFVSKTLIEGILKNSTYKKTFAKSIKTKKTGKLIDKQIANIQSISNNGSIVYYIINYVGGGYVIISADDRVNPILAFSESNKFDYNTAKTQNGIGLWLNEQMSAIDYVRDENLTQSEEVENAWEGLTSMAPPDPSSGSTTTYTNAFISTNWGQDIGYNNYTPIGSCGDHCLTGCVATAMSQIIRYNQYSSINNYNWSLMPDTYGTNETSRLMYDVGKAVNMKYGCSSSGAYDSSIPSGFAQFGYTNVKQTTNLITNWITNDLALNKPVILCGGGSAGRHCWVCDGSYYHSEWDANGGWSVQLFHMNWGWNGYCNDYFALSNLTPSGNYNFSSNLILSYNLYHLPI